MRCSTQFSTEDFPTFDFPAKAICGRPSCRNAPACAADFDGPLSVILLLLSKNKIEIQDVSITSILEQYLAYLDEMKRLDMEIASEFIAMASHLMLIKTKMLLSAAEREEAMSEMELLIRSLEEKQRAEAYEQIRTAVAFLEPRSDIGNGFFPHAPQPLRPDATYRYRHEPQDLLRAMAAMAERSERRLPPKLSNFQGIVGLEPYPVTKKAAQVLKQLLMRGVEKFCALFRGSRSRSEIVATFLAVLELCRVHSVRLEDGDDDLNIRFCKMPEERVEHGTDGAGTDR